MLFYSLFLFVCGLTEAGHLILGEVIPLDCGSDEKRVLILVALSLWDHVLM